MSMTRVAPMCLMIAGWLCLTVPGLAYAQRAVPSIKPLLIEAIRLGTAEGVMRGEAARFMAQTFGALTPIHVSVRRVRHLRTDGCARLEVDTRQAGVIERDLETGVQKEPTDQRMVYQINFCENGRFPEEGGGRI